MIAPGWLPARPRALGVSRRTLPYPRGRLRRTARARRPAPPAITGEAELVLFDHGCELPVATVLRAPRSEVGTIEMLVGGLQRWLLTRWAWFRPRTIPVVVAMLGMVAMLRAVNYLSHAQPTTTPPLAGTFVVGDGPAGAMIVVDVRVAPDHR